ncbi:hypothetical protein ACFOHY_04805 [Rhizobium rosettiformans]|uniref:hypothetical protein n=1 Tax=Rhizobium rosettiformans TaxID=1368430 RepID=UPI0036221979
MPVEFSRRILSALPFAGKVSRQSAVGRCRRGSTNHRFDVHAFAPIIGHERLAL